MRPIPAARFKQTCLKLLDEVARTGQPLTVTKRGRPVAQVIPIPRGKRARDWGRGLRGTIRILGDIVSPVVPPEDWEALRD